MWVFVRPSGTVLKGSSVTLACVSDASPPVENYTWFKNNMSTFVGSGQQYILTDISSEDAGLYFCEASSSYGAQMSNGTDIKIAGTYLSIDRFGMSINLCPHLSVLSDIPIPACPLSDECQCVAAASVGGLSGSVLGALCVLILLRYIVYK